jgi:hypothetical protein
LQWTQDVTNVRSFRPASWYFTVVLADLVKRLRRKHGKAPLGSRLVGAVGISSFVAVLGPGLLAGLSDDDPAGITTYSIAGPATATSSFGYC